MVVKQEILKLYKNRGETPLECILRFKKDNPEYKDEKMTYAGRLDPLAEGLLLVLVGGECKNKEKYLAFDKEYKVDVLFGFARDTYDILGKVTQTSKCESLDCNDGLAYSDIKKFQLVFNDVKTFIAKFNQKYPPFSSKTIKGKSLFSLFKRGELKDEEIPEKEVEIKDIKINGGRSISKIELEKYVNDSVKLVNGDFRQREILEIWEKSLNATKQNSFMIISLVVDCTSGTYMRSLANSIGEKVGIPALALNIKRTRVGEYKI